MKISLSTIIKLAIFNIALAVADIFIFSEGFVGLSPVALVSTKRFWFYIVLAIEIIVFLAVNMFLIMGTQKKMKIVDNNDLKQPRDYIKNLEDYLYKSEFVKEIKTLIGQVNRISPKQAGLETVLKQNFEPGELTFIKFKDTIDNVVELFFDNTKKAINRIAVFDIDEYHKLQKGELHLPEESRKLKLEIYAEHISYVNGLIQRNEEIITKLDNLMLEISKLDDINETSIENAHVLAELESLIRNTKYYN